jgi:uncharacterized protein YbaA (DUF1428 family)
MKALFTSLIVSATLLASCQSAPWCEPTVDEDHLSRVSEEMRDKIAEQQTEIDRLRDELAARDRAIELEQQSRRVAEQEVDVAEERVDVVEAQQSVGASDADVKDEKQNEEVYAARAHVSWANAQCDFLEARVAEAKAEKEVAQRKLDAEQARLELQKAEAVTEIEGDDVPEYDLSRFERAVDDAEMEIAMAEIDAEAAKRRAEVRKERMEKVADRVDASRRKTWNEVAVRNRASSDDDSERSGASR